MHLRRFLFLLIIAVALTTWSCEKEEGEGGNSSITGKVWIREYDLSFTYLISSYWGSDEDIYIIYGDDISYGNRIKTGPDGEFEFKYLRPGNYRLYVYSKDSTFTSGSGKIAVYKDVEITSRKQVVDAGVLSILKN